MTRNSAEAPAWIFFPADSDEMYAADFSVAIEENSLSATLCGKVAPRAFSRGLHGRGKALSHSRAGRGGFRREGFSTARHHSPNGARPEFSDRDHRRAHRAGIRRTRVQFAQSIFESRSSASRRRCLRAALLEASRLAASGERSALGVIDAARKVIEHVTARAHRLPRIGECGNVASRNEVGSRIRSSLSRSFSGRLG